MIHYGFILEKVNEFHIWLGDIVKHIATNHKDFYELIMNFVNTINNIF